jgi:hypothetical protein
LRLQPRLQCRLNQPLSKRPLRPPLLKRQLLRPLKKLLLRLPKNQHRLQKHLLSKKSPLTDSSSVDGQK